MTISNIGPVVHFNFDKCNEPYRFDYCFANLGAAFNIGADIYRFTIDLGYSLGLTNAFRVYYGTTTYDDPTVKQNTLTFSVGYRFSK